MTQELASPSQRKHNHHHNSNQVGAWVLKKSNLPIVFIIYVACCIVLELVLFANVSVPDIKVPSKSNLNHERNDPSSTDTVTFLEDADTTTEKDEDNYDLNNIHMVFSSSCSKSQTWESYLFFYQAWKVKQPGEMTRIVSGCKDAEQADLEQHHKDDVTSLMSTHFHVHFTPDYARVVKGQDYKYFNKPFGLRHWMEHSLGYPDRHAEHDDTIIVLVDPDMMLLKPLVNDFGAMPKTTWNDGCMYRPCRKRVRHGYPIVQQYGFGSDWLRHTQKHLNDIVGPVSPVHNLTRKDAALYYASGPPYILTARDMWAVVVKWTEFVPRIHKVHPELLAEMYGYSMAAAHLDLKNQISTGIMVTDPAFEVEGWEFIDKISPSQLCTDPNPDHFPHVIHYCQRYGIGEYFFNKYLLNEEFLTCEAPLLLHVPDNAALLYNFSRYGDGTTQQWYAAKHVNRMTFVTCRLYWTLNDAATFFKQNRCKGEQAALANYNKTWSLLYYLLEKNAKEGLNRAKKKGIVN